MSRAVAIAAARAMARVVARSMARALALANARVNDGLGLTVVPTLWLMQRTAT